MAAKTNTSESQIDKTSFWYAGLCNICHPGGGFGEYDRDGELYYDVETSEFGYEKLGKVAADVSLDGDYCEVSNSSGARRDAPWDVTGVQEPDCLLCHRLDRVINTGKNMNWIWRSATLRAKDNLVDTGATSVPAYAAAATASQGWFSSIALATVPAGKPPLAQTLDIDYQVGVDDGSLLEDAEGKLRINMASIAADPVDYACWGCHVTPDLKKRGRVWFDETQDVHYAGFNNLDDADTSNDIAPTASAACIKCHPAGMDHNIAKGNATLGSVRNDTDYVGFRTCRDCHLTGTSKDPAAPEPTNSIHTSGHLASMSCEFCHIPYKQGSADLVVDNATTGSTIAYKTADLLSADPLDPAGTDKTRWFPGFKKKADKDGVMRLFPVKLLLSVWWGDWDDRGTPSDLTDDIIKPIPLWRVRQGLSAMTPVDDNSDGKAEVNTPTEITAYITALKGNDSYGNQIAARPVLVKGGDVTFETTPGNVGSFNYEDEGVHTESSHPFSVNHNVLPTTEALGAGGACGNCHSSLNGGAPTPVFDRLMLISPFREQDAAPVYETVRLFTGVSPF